MTSIGTAGAPPRLMHPAWRAIATVAVLLLLTAAAVAAQTTVILVRHAEKEAEPANDPALTTAGKARAQRLAEYLKDAGIDAIYSTPYARTLETAQPVADMLGIAVTRTPLQGGVASFSKGIAARLRTHRDQTVLVVGHSNTLGPLIQALGAAAIPPIADDDYDNLFIVTIGANNAANLVRATF